MRAASRHAAIGAGLLALFALVGTTLVATTEHGTKARIMENERAFILRTLDVLVDPARYDNDLLEDRITVVAPEALGTSRALPVYRARLIGERVALVMEAVAPDGYSGDIRLLVGINADGTLAGVRVIAHRETPGLGDGIDDDRSDWIRGFEGLSLTNPEPAQWAVKRDGGAFDQFTGATITPRAVVAAVKRTLEYYTLHQDALWEPQELP